jgi:hypothetical protein|tara:strand:+ start:295 stop:483 length:189 start_codon:yes stop_codon:yes gene_type:complete
MSFKFKLGTIVEKTDEPELGLFRVVGLLIDGFINVRSLKTHRAQVMDGKDFEAVEDQTPRNY